jgi:hypothetical protein
MARRATVLAIRAGQTLFQKHFSITAIESRAGGKPFCAQSGS